MKQTELLQEIRRCDLYIIDGIAHAGKTAPALKISGVRPLEDYQLWVRFNTGEAKIFDFKSLLAEPAFAALTDKNVFNGVYIDYSVTVWNDGAIDIAPEKLYRDGAAASEAA